MSLLGSVVDIKIHTHTHAHVLAHTHAHAHTQVCGYYLDSSKSPVRSPSSFYVHNIATDTMMMLCGIVFIHVSSERPGCIFHHINRNIISPFIFNFSLPDYGHAYHLS